MDKVLVDIEKLKDLIRNRNTQTELTMIESVVALLMFVNAEIKEARLQSSMAECLRGKRHMGVNTQICYVQMLKGKAELEDNIDGSKSIKKLIID